MTIFFSAIFFRGREFASVAYNENSVFTSEFIKTSKYRKYKTKQQVKQKTFAHHASRPMLAARTLSDTSCCIFCDFPVIPSLASCTKRVFYSR